MKRKIFTAMAFLAIACMPALASADPGISEEVQASFAKEFSGAESVHWKEAGEYVKANFVYQGCVTEAYFSKDGQLEGTIRAVFFNQLPIAVMTSVNKRFSAAEVLDVYEITNANGTSYRITLTSEQKKFRVLADNSGSILEKARLKD